jgi:hypothetical protein
MRQVRDYDRLKNCKAPRLFDSPSSSIFLISPQDQSHKTAIRAANQCGVAPHADSNNWCNYYFSPCAQIRLFNQTNERKLSTTIQIKTRHAKITAKAICSNKTAFMSAPTTTSAKPYLPSQMPIQKLTNRTQRAPQRTTVKALSTHRGNEIFNLSPQVIPESVSSPKLIFKITPGNDGDKDADAKVNTINSICFTCNRRNHFRVINEPTTCKVKLEYATQRFRNNQTFGVLELSVSYPTKVACGSR